METQTAVTTSTATDMSFTFASPAEVISKRKNEHFLDFNSIRFSIINQRMFVKLTFQH